MNGRPGVVGFYLRNRGTEPGFTLHPTGLVVVDVESRRYGWSLCHPRDTFSKEMAWRIALGRLDSGRLSFDNWAMAALEELDLHSWQSRRSHLLEGLSFMKARLYPSEPETSSLRGSGVIL